MSNQYRTLISKPEADEADLIAAVKRRHTRLNELAAEGFQLVTTVTIDAVAAASGSVHASIVDTLTRQTP